MAMKLADILSSDSLRITRVLAAPPDRVWAHLVEAEKRARWFCAGDDLTSVGQKFELHFNHARITDEEPPEKYKQYHGPDVNVVSKGEVLAFEPPRLLRFFWIESSGEPSDVTFALSPDGAGTRVVITHAKLPNRGELVEVGGGWNAHLNVLEHELEGRKHPGFWSDIARFEEELERQVPHS